MRSTVYLYVVRTSPTPDKAEGYIPWRIDEDDIYFGPCKVHLRELLRRRFLESGNRTYAQVGVDERIADRPAGPRTAAGPAAGSWVLLNHLDFASREDIAPGVAVSHGEAHDQ